MSRNVSISRSSPRRFIDDIWRSFGPSFSKLPGADAHDLPARCAHRAILATVRLLALADMLQPEAPRAVVLDRDAQLREEDVRPDLDMTEERSAHAHGVEPGGHTELREEVGAQLRLDGGCRSGGAFAHERLSDGQRRSLRAQRLRDPRSSRPVVRANDGRFGEHGTVRAPGRPAALTVWSRPLLGRCRCEKVARIALPQQQHVRCRRDLRQHDAGIQLWMILPDQDRKRRPRLPIRADRVRHIDAVRKLPASPPILDPLRHDGTIPTASPMEASRPRPELSRLSRNGFRPSAS